MNLLTLLALWIEVFLEYKMCDGKESRFYKLKSPLYGPVRLGNITSAMSIISCISACQAKYDTTCRNVIFNKLKRTCIHATWMFTSVPPPASDEGQLYTRHPYSHCDASKGFIVLNSGNTYSCLSFISTAINYPDARDYCVGLGGFLASVKTEEKLKLVRRMAGSNPVVYIGLNDIDVEGTYIWEEDNSTLTQNQASLLWSDGEPNGLPTDGNDCGVLYNVNKLADASCIGSPFPFICEA